MQVHACWYDVILAINETDIENGSNIGHIVYPHQNGETLQLVHIKNNNYYTNVSVSVAFIAYDQVAPIPGQCNDDHNTTDLLVATQNEFIYVNTPLAAASRLPVNATAHQIVCNNATLSYSSYHLWMDRGDLTCQSYFDGVRKMLTINDIRQQGTLVRNGLL